MAAKQSKTKTTVKKEATAKTKSDFAVAGFTKTGATGAEIELPREVFRQKVNNSLVAQAVRTYLSNQRQGNAHTKTRAEVNRTKKKVYRQKGTGGARHGSKNAPLYVGGGRAHGPKNFENYSLTMPKKMARLALLSALSDKLSSKKVVVADIEGIEPKTKVLVQLLSKMGLSSGTIIHSGAPNLYKAGRNLKSVEMARAQELSTYTVIKSRMLILTSQAVEVLKGRLEKD
ncbi:MAG: 50S ribosomal protein L4 [Candidatus Blackburnbacteria bacterium]|nr:50S ribosomal protein L4 [Candidatus Blackburnbacteria bacterium]